MNNSLKVYFPILKEKLLFFLSAWQMSKEDLTILIYGISTNGEDTDSKKKVQYCIPTIKL